jgi:hypothetical protein
MGGSNKVNKTLERERLDEQKRSNELFAQAQKPTPEQERWRAQSAAWDTFLSGKDYSKPPPGTTLGFDLWSPAQTQKQRERMLDLEGIGAAGLGGGGDKSIALQLTRERNANQAAEDAGASYEGAVKDTDAYFKGQAPTYAGMQINQLQNLLGASMNREGRLTQQWVDTRPRSMLPMILGAGLQGAGMVFGAAGGAGGFGNLFGGGGGGGGGCWIAEALYGAGDLRTLVLRAWINSGDITSTAGRILIGLYGRFGEATAQHIRTFPILQRLFRPVFDRASRKAFRWANAV